MESWHELWNIRVSENKTHGHLLLSWTDQQSVLLHQEARTLVAHQARCVGTIFDRKITQRIHIEAVKAKDFRTFVRVYSLLKSEQWNTNSKLTLHNALSKCMMTMFATQEIYDRHFTSEIAASLKQGSPHEWQLSKTHIDPKYRCDFQNSLRLCFYL
jgi:hypothetical protein